MPTWDHVCGACCGAENKRPHLRLKYLKVPETSNVKLWIMQSSFRCNKQQILRCSEDSTVCLNFGSGSDRIPNGLGVLALPRWKGQTAIPNPGSSFRAFCLQKITPSGCQRNYRASLHNIDIKVTIMLRFCTLLRTLSVVVQPKIHALSTGPYHFLIADKSLTYSPAYLSGFGSADVLQHGHSPFLPVPH